MKLKDFLQVIGFLFIVKAVFGVVYLLLGLQANIAGWVLPMWLILVAILVDAFLAMTAFKLVKK